MAPIIELQQKELPDNCFVFKHSTRCPISAAAAEEVRQASFSLPLYWINVVEQRDLSNWVAEELATRHESPQLLRVENGEAVKVWNHRQIRRGEIEG